jgi:hypothetical protein
MRFIVHFPEQTIIIDSETYHGHCNDKETAEFYASSRVVADSVEEEL